MTDLVIRNIGELVAVPPGPISGRAMDRIPCIRSAALVIHDDRIAWFGPEHSLNVSTGTPVWDAGGGCVVPGLIDGHTHAVFAGTREQEFVQRIEGQSYLQIAEAGGGIRVTVDAVRQATMDELVLGTLPRLQRMLGHGVTCVEIKSGYGLTVADELKMLKAVRVLADHQPIELVGTYLAAHAVPREFSGRPDAYLDTVLDDEVLGMIARDRLAEFCDVFCERSAFTLEQSGRVLRAGLAHGLKPKIHADQITSLGGSVLAGEVGAVSADHLEHIDDEGIAALARGGTLAVVLPGCSLFLGVPQAPVRRMLEADLPVAVATDCNPGSSMIESLPLVMSIACTQLRMTPTEAVVAATANAAAALGRQDRLGAIHVGHQADLVVLDVPNHARWMYDLGRPCIREVLIRGRTVNHGAPRPTILHDDGP